MRSAPSVVYPVGRCAFHGRLLLALSALGLATLTGWAWSDSGRVFREGFWAGLVLWALWSAWVFNAWWRTPMGALHWDSLASPFGDSQRAGAWRVEMNLDPSDITGDFSETRLGRASEVVPVWVTEVLGA